MSCAVKPVAILPGNTEISMSENLQFLLLPAFNIAKPLSLTQAVKIQYHDKQYDFIARMEIADQSFKMVGLSTMGIQLFSIYSTDSYYEFETTPLIGKELNLSYLLADLQLAYWPIDLLNSQLRKQDAFIEVAALQRSLFQNARALVEIQYSNSSDWNKNITFKHLQRDYSVIITTLEMEYL